MTRFILVSFAFLAFCFWELSGGAEYQPRVTHEPIFAPAVPLEDRPRFTETAGLFPTTDETEPETASASLADRLGDRAESADLRQRTDLIVQAAIDADVPAPPSGDAVDRLAAAFGAQPILDISQEGLSAVGITGGSAGALTGQTISIATFGTTPPPEPRLRVMPATVEPAPAPAPEPAPERVAGSGPDLRRVTGDSVNMRTGPGTNFTVVTRLERDQVVEVLGAELGLDAETWLRLRVTDTGEEGFMASWLVTGPDQ